MSFFKVSKDNIDKEVNKLQAVINDEVVPFFKENMPHDILRISPAEVLHYYYQSSEEKMKEDPTARSYDDLDDDQFEESLKGLKAEKLANNEGKSLLRSIDINWREDQQQFVLMLELEVQGKTLREHPDCTLVWNILKEAHSKHPNISVELTSDDREDLIFTANSLDDIKENIKNEKIEQTGLS